MYGHSFYNVAGTRREFVDDHFVESGFVYHDWVASRRTLSVDQDLEPEALVVDDTKSDTVGVNSLIIEAIDRDCRVERTTEKAKRQVEEELSHSGVVYACSAPGSMSVLALLNTNANEALAAI